MLIAGFICSDVVTVAPFALAVSVAVCVEETALTVAANVALVAFAGMVTDAGTVTAALLLVRLTPRPPLPAAALSVTVQLSVSAPVIDVSLHDTPFKTPTAAAEKVCIPVPFSCTVAALADALVATVNSPVAAPALAGLNCNCTTELLPPAIDRGKLAPTTLNDCPAMLICET
jgi:hypothetical protein